MKRPFVLALGFAAAGLLPAQRPGDNGPAINAQLNAPSQLVLDAEGNIYVYESKGEAIRRIDHATRLISTVAEECRPAARNSTPTDCFGPIGDLQVTNSGHLVFAEFTFHRVSEYDPASRRFTVLAGARGVSPAAGLILPCCVALDRNGNVLVCSSNGTIRRIDPHTGAVTTVAGSGKHGFAGDGRPALAARFSLPISIAVDSHGNLFIADNLNNRIRRVDAKTGIVETIAGVGPSGPAHDILFCCEGGPAAAAHIRAPRSLVFDRDDNLFFVSAGRICRIDRSTGHLTTVAEIDAADLALDREGNLFLAELENNRIRRIDARTGVFTTIAGNGFPRRPPAPLR
jgi:sugar lactone lactonase YvrE